MNSQKPASPIKASTQSFTEIEDIKDDIILLKDYSAATVIEVGSVNFWLLAPDEQTSMIYAYSNLLNSLSFPVQILILSKKMDISAYLEYLEKKIESQKNETIQSKLLHYKEFIKNTVKKSTVLEKRFFFVIPFSPLELGISGIKPQTQSKEYLFTRAKTSLYPKQDNLMRLLTRIGLKSKVVLRQELAELFYNLYNPSPTGKSLAEITHYTEAMVTGNES